jgi:hypothetical protein
MQARTRAFSKRHVFLKPKPMGMKKGKWRNGE